MMIVMNVVVFFFVLIIIVCVYFGVLSKIGDLIDNWVLLVKFVKDEFWKLLSVEYFLFYCKLEGCISELISLSFERCNRDSFIVIKDGISCFFCIEFVVFCG